MTEEVSFFKVATNGLNVRNEHSKSSALDLALVSVIIWFEEHRMSDDLYNVKIL